MSRESGAGLPAPSAAAADHSARLVEHIRRRLEAAGGRLPFADYMQEALYAPGLGYYSAGSRKLGPAGDFTTAPELSPLFGRCLARQCADVLAELGGGDILEFGAGSGRLAADLLAELERLGRPPARYLILEVSADLRERQRETLARLAPGLAARVAWVETPPAGLRGVILANEVLDALPVHRFRLGPAGVEEGCVAWSGTGFAWEWTAPRTPGLAERAAAVLAGAGGGQAPGYASELGLAAGPWIAALGGSLAAGLALLVDYGFPRREFYHPERAGGTLMCHYRHRAHDDPFFLPGLQDITAHVDFTAVAEAADAAGLRVAGYTSQAAFLLATGITELAAGAEVAGDAALAAAGHALNRLLSPAEMGELFKVIALTRGLDAPLRGFALQDRRGRL
ncbi:class I SAM-dependent methyltransferase [Thioalbus denitrificans]|uniref:SAM-dependent MidA family methyltransferase n=1 Tax=Thioalbus denitrificans TaxID=547122 RepID=A0A369CJY8_9GAMM|nr:SAM-dependent methyltransferase [Thioalbus denitrificans]RCX33006.1 SAM-dependent MidA family methyltransferase [Thioalbus denitrificans]